MMGVLNNFIHRIIDQTYLSGRLLIWCQLIVTDFFFADSFGQILARFESTLSCYFETINSNLDYQL